MDDTWLIFIGLGKLPINFQRHARSHLLLLLMGGCLLFFFPSWGLLLGVVFYLALSWGGKVRLL